MSNRNPRDLEGMKRFGINVENALVISIPKLRAFAKKIGKDHKLAREIWNSGIHEARLLASLIDDPDLVIEAQMEEWVGEFDSWDICDQCCSNLFDKTKFAYKKAVWWSKRDEEFVKRAGFVMMATLAVHDKDADDSQFLEFLKIVEKNSEDERNFVKKAINWALRQIGKRNRALNIAAIAIANRIGKSDSRAARWIASNALKELESSGVQKRLRRLYMFRPPLGRGAHVSRRGC